MEVSVLEVQNVPSTAYISISSGSVHQQAHLEVGKPLLFPAKAAEGKISVSLYEQLGTATMASQQGKEDVFVVPVKSGNGTSTQVKLRTRCPGGRPPSMEQCNGNAQILPSASWQYLGQNDLQNVVSSLLHEVLRDRPQNPYAFMAGKLKQHRGKGVNSSGGDWVHDSVILESRKSTELPAANLDTLASQAIGAEMAARGEAREQAQSMLDSLFGSLNESLGPTFPERAKTAKENGGG
mmetsp:Transcript_21539/g.49211  ORF Transcript_21539/g.49211 Transcript_21539/m.49211 type:complete len:238 (+) Transcript_21539:47-760(+)